MTSKPGKTLGNGARFDDSPFAAVEASPVEVGECYEFTHGPSSHEGRKLRGVLEEIDQRENVYTFRLEDGTRISLVMHEVQGPRHVPEGC